MLMRGFRCCYMLPAPPNPMGPNLGHFLWSNTSHSLLLSHQSEFQLYTCHKHSPQKSLHTSREPITITNISHCQLYLAITQCLVTFNIKYFFLVVEDSIPCNSSGIPAPMSVSKATLSPPAVFYTLKSFLLRVAPSPENTRCSSPGTSCFS